MLIRFQGIRHTLFDVDGLSAPTWAESGPTLRRDISFLSLSTL